MIPYGRQEITQADIDSVVEVLRSDFLTQGPKVPAFELALSIYCGAKFAVAVNSATSALHIACLALGLGKGDLLWTTPITFVASANCALYCDAEVNFVDIDPRTFNLCPVALEAKLRDAQQKGRLPKIVLVVHLCGQPCDMKAIHFLSQKFGFRVIEDASHAIGARYQNQPVGDCRYSDITVFSFHPVKIITTAEGGMAVTNHPELARTMELLRSHGITREPMEMTHESDGSWYYQQIKLGFNYRMTELQAALGLSQIQRLDAYVQQRQILAVRYNQLLEGVPIFLPWQHADAYSAFHLYVVRIDFSRTSKTHRQVFEGMRAKGVGVNLHYIPVHTQPYYREKGFSNVHFPNAERYYAEALSIPLYATLTEQQQDEVVSALREVLSA